MNIEQLALQVAAQIAAGEVIERPASVVKELVENSIDADATKIIVEIKGSGVEQIRVSDNGSGIPADELSLAFQRHTTSKLRNAEDLQTITTLGFRGEALPSIASVSIVECHSRTPDTEAGTRICMQHGSMQGPPQAYGCPMGTTFQISDLFGNTPVRKKFLRTRNTELNHIQQAVARYAMAQPGIKFLLIMDSRNALETPGKLPGAAGSSRPSWPSTTLKPPRICWDFPWRGKTSASEGTPRTGKRTGATAPR